MSDDGEVLAVGSSHSQLNSKKDGGFSAGYIGYEEDPGNVGVYRFIPENDGEAEFSIDGETEVGETISLVENNVDPDGTGDLIYSWQTSSDNSSWLEVGTDSSYSIQASDEGKSIKAVISYIDDQGFDEVVITSSSSIYYVIFIY